MAWSEWKKMGASIPEYVKLQNGDSIGANYHTTCTYTVAEKGTYMFIGSVSDYGHSNTTFTKNGVEIEKDSNSETQLGTTAYFIMTPICICECEVGDVVQLVLSAQQSMHMVVYKIN